MSHFKLERNHLQQNANGQLRLLVQGSRTYKDILSLAFPSSPMTSFTPQFGAFTWGAFISDLGNQRPQLEMLLKLLEKHLLIEDDLTHTFALDLHTAKSAAGRYSRTEIGELVYQAKYTYKTDPAAMAVAATAKNELGRAFCDFVQSHPTYQNVDTVLSVPPSNPNKPFDLPKFLAERIAQTCGFRHASGVIVKNRVTTPMKDIGSVSQKLENIQGVFSVTDQHQMHNKKILLIDDIYQTGLTINEVGKTLIAAGANAVFGLVASKTGKDL
jgi:predicted amidophosphoribosyltransferase